MELPTDERYNKELSQIDKTNYREINRYVMTHTKAKCELDTFLQESIKNTIANQFIVFENEDINAKMDGPTTNIVLSKKRTFEAAKTYKGKKVAVLNFADNHYAGGFPYSSGAQEESLCRTSTLLECLTDKLDEFYIYHRNLFDNGKLDYWGNDDLIYSPDVVVFKTDESAPKMMKQDEWYKVDVITCAAPELQKMHEYRKEKLYEKVFQRLRKVFEVAKKENVEVLILGAWGCGAFANPPEVAAKAFKKMCSEYHFDTVEFAVFDRKEPSVNYETFRRIIKGE